MCLLCLQWIYSKQKTWNEPAKPGSPGKLLLKWRCDLNIYTKNAMSHSASEVTTLWRYTNLFIIIIIIYELIWQKVDHVKVYVRVCLSLI